MSHTGQGQISVPVAPWAALRVRQTMKNGGLLFSLLASVMLSRPAHAQRYFFLNGGGGGAAQAGSVGGEAGKMFPSPDPKYLLGGSFSVAFNGRNGGNLGPAFQIHIRDEQQINAVAGVRLVKHLFLVGLLGVAAQSERDVITPVGQPQVIEEAPLHTYLSGAAQFRYVRKRAMVGVGYDSRRGVVGGLGLTF